MTNIVSSQMALISVVTEAPPKADGAILNQVAIISVSREYVIPIIYIPFSAGAFFQTMPYYIGQ